MTSKDEEENGPLGSEVVNMIEYPFFPYTDEGRPSVVGLLYEMIMAVNWELVPFAPNPILFHLGVLFSYIKIYLRSSIVVYLNIPCLSFVM